MSGKFICCALVLISLAVLSVNAGCVCNEKGVDYCAKHKEPVFVRPKPRYVYPNPDLDLKPIGDTCSCNKVFVEPATMPKPCNNKVRDTFQWFWIWNNLLKRKAIEAVINAKHEHINRLHKRLTNLEN
ncbi:PREDICTED: uncharacterized protein LOC108382224, partial [Rhagoletis zephyria]|uniref:uncharacterized protein LOC108382224 n=1 Tax=Rhagoletis zephyria TaxID=28612 RepID=UPI00081137E8